MTYASNPTHASPTEVLLRGKKYNVQVVFQLRVRPDSFEISPCTLKEYVLPGAEESYKDQEEWITKRHGCVIPYGVVISDVALS